MIDKEIKKKPFKSKDEDEEPIPRRCQHLKILDCNQPIHRLFYECWHCQQGLLSEVEVQPPEQLEIPCPTCGRPAIRIVAKKVLSTTAIPSPWG